MNSSEKTFGNATPLAKAVNPGWGHAAAADGTSATELAAFARIFNRSWAIAALFDKAWYDHWVYSPSNFILAFTALVLFIRPGCAACLITFCVAQTCDYFSESKVMANHPWIMVLVDTMLLVTAVRFAWRGEWSADVLAKIFHEVLPAIRVSVLIVYFWATFHKLNTDFLNPDTSCVSLLMYGFNHRPLLFSFYHPPTWQVLAGIHGTLVVEALIPLLLSFRRTRAAGILLAVAFHSFLSFGIRNGFYAFSVVIFPLLMSFVSPSWAARLDAWVVRLAWPHSKGWWGWVIRAMAALTVGLLSIFSHRLGISRVCPAWFTYNTVILTFILFDLWRHGVQSLPVIEPRPFRLARIGLIMLVTIVFVNGACPYLGLKTENSFAMYSNLRTEGNRPNHLIVPGWFSIFPGQEDLVEVFDCSVPQIREWSRQGLHLPYFQLCSEMTNYPEASIVFRHQQQVYRVTRVADRPDLLPSIPLWKRRLFPFRPVEPSGPQGCRH